MHALCRVLFRRPGLHELRTANSPPGRWGSSQGCPHRTVWPSWAIHTPGSYGRHPARAQRHAGQESAHQEAPRAFDLMALGKQPRDSILAAGAGQRLAGMLVQLLSWVLMARGCQSQVGMGGATIQTWAQAGGGSPVGGKLGGECQRCASSSGPDTSPSVPNLIP